jgi:hypothetical protein
MIWQFNTKLLDLKDQKYTFPLLIFNTFKALSVNNGRNHFMKSAPARTPAAGRTRLTASGRRRGWPAAAAASVPGPTRAPAAPEPVRVGTRSSSRRSFA